MCKSGRKRLARFSVLTFRYIDDVLSLNNHKFGDCDCVSFIYPQELEIKDTTNSPTSVDILLSSDHDKHLTTKIYDKRDDLYSLIVNFTLLKSINSESPAYGV